MKLKIHEDLIEEICPVLLTNILQNYPNFLKNIKTKLKFYQFFKEKINDNTKDNEECYSG